jgi:hypothetical protein
MEDVDVSIHFFLTSPLVGEERSASRPCHFITGKDPPILFGQEVEWNPEPVWAIWRSYIS